MGLDGGVRLVMGSGGGLDWDGGVCEVLVRLAMAGWVWRI